MKVSKLVTLLAVAGVPAVCEKEPATTTPGRGRTPQQTSAFDAAAISWMKSKHDTPEGTSFENAMNAFAATIPYKSLKHINSLLASPTETGSAASAKWSSGVTQLPSVEQSYLISLQSVASTFLASLSESVEATARSQSPTSTIVDVFSNPTMTPEQNAEIDAKIDDYLQSLVDAPEYSSFVSKMATEQLDSSAIERFATQTVSGSSAFNAQMSSFFDLYPTYARSHLSSVAYHEMSIMSDVLNAPTTDNVLVSTVAKNATSTSVVAWTTTTPSSQKAISSAISKQAAGKGHSSKTKNGKKHSTITSRAALPVETVELSYPYHVEWNAEQSLAMQQGAASLLSSLLAHPKDLSKVIDATTVPGWTELKPYFGSAATRLLTDSKEFKSVLGHMPTAASKVFSKLIVQEISLLSKVDKMVSQTTMQTKTKSKRQYTDSDEPYDFTVDNDSSTDAITTTLDLMAQQSSAQYNAEISYDSSMMKNPVYTSILDGLDKWNFPPYYDPDYSDYSHFSWLAEVGPIKPTGYYQDTAEDASRTSEFSSMVATLSSNVQAFFSSVASDQASIESSVSATFATSTASSGGKQVVSNSATVTLTGKKNSAPGKEAVSSGVLAIGLIVVMMLL